MKISNTIYILYIHIHTYIYIYKYIYIYIYTDEVVIEFSEREMKEKWSANDIDRSHRLGKKLTGSRPRHIIIKFARCNARNVIFRKKKILKGKAVSITENLTKKRITEMKVARETYGFKNVWSQDGKILYTDANDRNKIKVLYD